MSMLSNTIRSPGFAQALLNPSMGNATWFPPETEAMARQAQAQAAADYQRRLAQFGQLYPNQTGSRYQVVPSQLHRARFGVGNVPGMEAVQAANIGGQMRQQNAQARGFQNVNAAMPMGGFPTSPAADAAALDTALRAGGQVAMRATDPFGGDRGMALEAGRRMALARAQASEQADAAQAAWEEGRKFTPAYGGISPGDMGNLLQRRAERAGTSYAEDLARRKLAILERARLDAFGRRARMGQPVPANPMVQAIMQMGPEQFAEMAKANLAYQGAREQAQAIRDASEREWQSRERMTEATNAANERIAAVPLQKQDELAAMANSPEERYRRQLEVEPALTFAEFQRRERLRTPTVPNAAMPQQPAGNPPLPGANRPMTTPPGTPGGPTATRFSGWLDGYDPMQFRKAGGDWDAKGIGRLLSDLDTRLGPPSPQRLRDTEDIIRRLRDAGIGPQHLDEYIGSVSPERWSVLARTANGLGFNSLPETFGHPTNLPDRLRPWGMETYEQTQRRLALRGLAQALLDNLRAASVPTR